MLYVIRESTEPYFNIAAEEYFLKYFEEEIFMLWQNDPCIIVGKHQNTLAEINIEYVEKHNIPVIRRITGGGTVFHDLGNLNFTFIQKGQDENLVNFRKFTKPVIDALATLGIEAKFEGRNDLTVNGKKISGNAEHVYKNRVLHHGTLLFSSVLTDLQSALKVDPDKFKDKSVKSVRSRVTNISNYLEETITIAQFREHIKKQVLSNMKNVKQYYLTKSDIDKIELLKKEKYNTWDWNFGYSPKYNFKKSSKLNGGKVEFNIDVKDGKITKTKIYGDFFGSGNLNEFENSLKGLLHNKINIESHLERIDIEKYFDNISRNELLNCMF
jgi:lipoate-protein ligase A